MPCALTETDKDYPDYLKKILKEIDVGNDDELKDCACSLKTLTTDEGCPITDSDGKLVAFPFCLNDTNPNLGNENVFYISDIGMSYKDAMKLYWKRDPINISFQANGTLAIESEKCPVLTSIGSTSLKSDNITLKDLVCGIAKSASISSDNPNKPGFSCRSDSCDDGQYYGASCFYFGVELSIFLEYYIDGSRAWIDKEAQLIYPYIYGLESLSGCCGTLGPISGSASSNNITINTSTNPGFSGSASGKIIVSFK